ncbi:hypothetical protein HPB48_021314 [Haemaphysalis longicornis]|uniref:Ionotropic glutamate receptor C-terminal domain-containing protein n=1 Tax=Haemaphysalis longicornis TaxID=44386 RepID=A0A9J6GRM6_HAELO|nr:hypothetical protein HPB48_021314 [Haemaphysalis longicornis]
MATRNNSLTLQDPQALLTGPQNSLCGSDHKAQLMNMRLWWLPLFLCICFSVRFLVRGSWTSRLSENLNDAVKTDYQLNVIHNCHRFPLEIVKKIAVPYTIWDSGGIGDLFFNLRNLTGHSVDVLVACWEPSLGHLLTLVESIGVPFLHVRWIFLAGKEAPTVASMSKALEGVGCRGLFVAASSIYVALDTYTNCSSGIRRFSGPKDDAFKPRPLASLTRVRQIDEDSLLTTKDWRNRRLEPQTTIVESIMRKTNATISTEGQFEKFGRAGEQLLFNGAIGAIQAKKKDLGIFEIYLTENIWYAIGIAGVARYDSLTFLAPLPTPITDLTIIGRPFTLALWMAVWASLGVYLLLLIVITSTHSMSGLDEPTDVLEQSVELFFYLSSALVNHAPSVRLSRHSSARILVAFWFMFAMVISAGFMGMLKSYTNFPPKTRPITTLQQLSRALERKTVNVCIKNNRYFRNILLHHLISRSTILREHLEDKMVSKIGCKVTHCCLEKVSAGTHVFVSNREEARFHTGKAFKGAVRADEDFFMVHVVIIAPKASPYIPAFYHDTLRLVETGVSKFALRLARLQNKRKKDFRETSLYQEESCFCRALQLKDLYGLLVVWAFGLTLGLLVLCFELGWNAFRGASLFNGRRRGRAAKRRHRAKEKPSLSEVINPDNAAAIVIFGVSPTRLCSATRSAQAPSCFRLSQKASSSRPLLGWNTLRQLVLTSLVMVTQETKYLGLLRSNRGVVVKQLLKCFAFAADNGFVRPTPTCSRSSG